MELHKFHRKQRLAVPFPVEMSQIRHEQPKLSHAGTSECKNRRFLKGTLFIYAWLQSVRAVCKSIYVDCANFWKLEYILLYKEISIN